MAVGNDSGQAGGPGSPRLDWPTRIREALSRDRFVLHAQRIVDVATGTILRHELFLRMVHRKRLIPAAEFMVAAEEFGSIREIDRWVVARAIELAATGRGVDLNLSMRSTDEALLNLIRTRIEETGSDPANLVLELSEEQLAEATEPGQSFVHAVSELGCGVALDGFVEGGRGSVLLQNFPIDYVKLGAAFIQGLATERSKRREVTSAVLKAHRNDQRVIAQGVEDIVTLELLGDLGIDEAQGYALGPPESVESLLGATA
jgi:EAL domain-containing protein (putative c-di-GMP-specific phosphodiesterase class I)